jgi:hypothetical protein
MKPTSGRRGGIAAIATPGAAAPVAAQGNPPREKLVHHPDLPGGEEFAVHRQVLTHVANPITVLTRGPLELRVVMPGLA